MVRRMGRMILAMSLFSGVGEERSPNSESYIDAQFERRRLRSIERAQRAEAREAEIAAEQTESETASPALAAEVGPKIDE